MRTTKFAEPPWFVTLRSGEAPPAAVTASARSRLLAAAIIGPTLLCIAFILHWESWEPGNEEPTSEAGREAL
jgi:hypothetical protein